MAAPVSGAPPDPSLSCMQDALDQCKEARFQLPRVGKDEFSKMYEIRRMKFAEWIRPVALYVQATTGMPASVFIAQAGLASEWGASPEFRNNNNLFKHKCWVPNSVITGEIELGGRKFTYKGTCGTEKIFNQVGRPLKFATREESVLAYLHVLLFSPSKYYRNLQEELKRGLKHVPVRQASFRSVAGVLNSFSPDNKYVGLLQMAIQQEKFATYDNPACWQCLVQQPKPAPPPAGPLVTPGTVPAPIVAPAPAKAGGS